MLKITLSAVVALVAVISLIPNPANAQTRVFVAGQGSDSNPCTFAAPCRTFQHAHDTVAAGGEIDVLDPAGYGAVTITKSVSIQGHGFSGITATSGTAITINAHASDFIELRGLVIEGFGTGSTGIFFIAGRSLVVENTTIGNFSGTGLVFNPSALSALTVLNSSVSNNCCGITAVPFGTSNIQVVFKNVQALNNSLSGFRLDSSQMAGGSLAGLAIDCVALDMGFFNSSSIGYSANAAGAKVGFGAALFTLYRSAAAGNAIGAKAENSAHINVAQSVLETNTQIFSQVNNGVVVSYGDNYTDATVLGSAIFSRD